MRETDALSQHAALAKVPSFFEPPEQGATFDGATLAYHFAPSWSVRATAGAPVEDSGDFLKTRRRFETPYLQVIVRQVYEDYQDEQDYLVHPVNLVNPVIMCRR